MTHVTFFTAESLILTALAEVLILALGAYAVSVLPAVSPKAAYGDVRSAAGYAADGGAVSSKFDGYTLILVTSHGVRYCHVASRANILAVGIFDSNVFGVFRTGSGTENIW
jgi:hypothetical protein